MFKRVLLAVDLDEPGSWARALPAAVDVCASSGARLYVTTVAPELGTQVAPFFAPDANERLLQSAQDRLRNFVAEHIASELDAGALVAQGSIHREIVNTARNIDADLIVLAAHKPGVRDYLLGANAAQVARHFERSVLLVRE